MARYELRTGPERASSVLADAKPMSGRGIELRRLVEPSLRVTNNSEDLAIADHLAAKAVGDRLQERVTVAGMQRPGGTENLIELILGKAENGHL